MNAVNFLERKIAVNQELVTASYTLSVNEKRIIYLALAKINQFKQGQLAGEITVAVEDFAKMSGKIDKETSLLQQARTDNARRDLNTAVKELFERKITIANGAMRWIYKYKDTTGSGNNNEIKFTFNPDIIPFLEDLRSYANVFAQSLVGLNGTYTNRLLELVSLDKSRERLEGKKYICFAELALQWQLPASYAAFKDFNNKVLKPCIAELRKNDVVDIVVTYKKDGRKVIGFFLEWEFLKRGSYLIETLLEHEIASK